jgi:hypothetical protein
MSTACHDGPALYGIAFGNSLIVRDGTGPWHPAASHQAQAPEHDTREVRVTHDTISS